MAYYIIDIAVRCMVNRTDALKPHQMTMYEICNIVHNWSCGQCTEVVRVHCTLYGLGRQSKFRNMYQSYGCHNKCILAHLMYKSILHHIYLSRYTESPENYAMLNKGTEWCMAAMAGSVDLWKAHAYFWMVCTVCDYWPQPSALLIIG